MATNKWLQDMVSLKTTTDLLRTEISSGGISTSKTDTLSQLVGKVPLLSPIVLQDKWQPDPLWKFPDPNGTGTTKTIREIYDEDALASSYTYRGIYQIRGDLDTIDLKMCMNQRTSADTFILSDGTTYENITATTLEHTWDKSKDIIDSNGVPMRYVRIYTNNAYNYVISFYCQAVWIIHNLGTQTSIISNSSGLRDVIGMYNNINIQCIEFEDKCTNPLYALNSSGEYTTLGLLGWAKKLVIKNYTSSYAVYVINHHLKEVYFYNDTHIDYIYGLFSMIDILEFCNDDYTNTTLTFIDYFEAYSSSPSYINLVELNLSKFTKATTLNMPVNCMRLKKLHLPPNISTFNTSPSQNGGYSVCGDLIDIIDFPETLTTFNNRYSNQSNILRAKVIRFNSIPTTVWWGTIYGLEDFIIPSGWNTTFPRFTSSNLNKDAILNMFENLADLTGSTAKTITLGKINLAKLTDEEKAIATNKNWTLS